MATTLTLLIVLVAVTGGAAFLYLKIQDNRSPQSQRFTTDSSFAEKHRFEQKRTGTVSVSSKAMTGMLKAAQRHNLDPKYTDPISAELTKLNRRSGDDFMQFRIPLGCYDASSGAPKASFESFQTVTEPTRIFSRGDTPVGIAAGATGSGKTGSFLIPALALHGRGENYLPVQNPYVGSGKGAPAVIFAPKLELFEIALGCRLDMAGDPSKIAVLWLGSPASCPPAIKPWVRPWSPLAYCEDFMGAGQMAAGLVEGSLDTEPYWQSAAQKVLHAAMWIVVNEEATLPRLENGRFTDRTFVGSSLADVYDRVFESPNPGKRTFDAAQGLIQQLDERGDYQDLRATVAGISEAVATLAGDGKAGFELLSLEPAVLAELEFWAAALADPDLLPEFEEEEARLGRLVSLKELVEDAMRNVFESPNAARNPLYGLLNTVEAWIAAGRGPSAKTAARWEDAHLCRRLLLDIASDLAAPATVGSTLNTLGTALKSTAIPGLANTGWNDPGAIDITDLLLDNAGTVFVGAPAAQMQGARPISSAFYAALWDMATARATKNGGRLDSQLLIMLDELTTVMGDTDTFKHSLALARSHGLQIFYATQSIASLDDHWSEAARTHGLVNTPDLLFLPGAGPDTASAELTNQMGGDFRETLVSETTSSDSNSSKSTAPAEKTSTAKGKSKSSSRSSNQAWRDLVPKGRLGELELGQGLLFSAGKVTPILATFWEEDAVIAGIIEGLYDTQPAPGPEVWQ